MDTAHHRVGVNREPYLWGDYCAHRQFYTSVVCVTDRIGPCHGHWRAFECCYLRRMLFLPHVFSHTESWTQIALANAILYIHIKSRIVFVTDELEVHVSQSVKRHVAWMPLWGLVVVHGSSHRLCSKHLTHSQINVFFFFLVCTWAFFQQRILSERRVECGILLYAKKKKKNGLELC